MDNEKIYEILAEFIKCAGMTNKSFATYAGIKPSSFQAMINRKSSMKTETFNKIKNAMLDIVETSDESQINKLKVIFLDLTEPNGPPSSYRDYNVNNHLLAAALAELDEQERQEIMSVADDIANETLKSQKMNLQLFAGKDNRSRLLDAFDRMNEKGQSVAADRVEELSKIPDYQKSDEN